MNVKLLVLTPIAIAGVSAAASADHTKVAVVPTIAVNVDAGRVDALGQDLAESLSAELEVDAIGGLEVRRRLPVDGIPPDCATTLACATDVARRLGVAQLLFVVMVDSGGGAVQVDATWVEPQSGRIAARAAIDLAATDADADARLKFATAARRILPDAKVRAKRGAVPDLVQRAAVPRHFTRASALTTAGVGVGLVVGIGFGLETRSKYNACNAMALECGSGERGTIRTLGLAADAGFVIAIGCAAATAIMFATSAEAAHVVVSPTANGVSLAAIGVF